MRYYVALTTAALLALSACGKKNPGSGLASSATGESDFMNEVYALSQTSPDDAVPIAPPASPPPAPDNAEPLPL